MIGAAGRPKTRSGRFRGEPVVRAMGTSFVPAYAGHEPSSKKNSASRIDRRISIASGRTGPHAATTTADTDLSDAWSPLTHEGFLTLLPVCQILPDKSR